MTVSITHAKVSSAPEGDDPNKVRTSDWNDDHVLAGGNLLLDFDHKSRTSGDVTVTADAVWADLDTGIDITLAAATGDVIEACLSVGAFGSEATAANFDVVTVVSGSPVTSFGSGATPSDSNNGVAGWRISPSLQGNASGGVMYTLQSGDISGGNVLLRLRVRTSTSTNRVVNATASNPLKWYAKNLGQAL